jgi:hypothetical protein
MRILVSPQITRIVPRFSQIIISVARGVAGEPVAFKFHDGLRTPQFPITDENGVDEWSFRKSEIALCGSARDMNNP